MTFWKTATKEQKLSQIDGGIECGMTARQVAVNCGTTAENIRALASRCGRSFNHGISVGWGRASLISSQRSRGVPNERITDAFNIFGAKESKWEMEL
jgi:hypothetical protein